MTGAVIVAAGRGARLGGGEPKCLRELAGKPLYQYSLETAFQCEQVDMIVLVVQGDHVARCRDHVQHLGPGQPVEVTHGGATRQESVQRGVEQLSPEVTWCAVHDAARPRARAVLWNQVIAAAHLHGGAIAAVPAADTLKHVTGEVVDRTLDRSRIWQAQTPQVFRADQLLAALRDGAAGGESITDEAAAMERAGHPIRVVPATADNFKISTPADWEFAEYLVARGWF